MTMGFFEILLITTTFLCSLTAGFLFAFSVVVFPGIKALADKEFIRAFQEMDLVIQNNQPVFMIVWVGSILAIIASGIMAFWHLTGTNLIILITAVTFYLIGVQVPTIAVNIPLNLNLQSVTIDKVDEKTIKQTRKHFETRWTRSNTIRTLFSAIVSMLCMILLFRI